VEENMVQIRGKNLHGQSLSPIERMAQFNARVKVQKQSTRVVFLRLLA
jgi:hypothetical protein